MGPGPSPSPGPGPGPGLGLGPGPGPGSGLGPGPSLGPSPSPGPGPGLGPCPCPGSGPGPGPGPSPSPGPGPGAETSLDAHVASMCRSSRGPSPSVCVLEPFKSLRVTQEPTPVYEPTDQQPVSTSCPGCCSSCSLIGWLGGSEGAGSAHRTKAAFKVVFK